MPLRGDVFGEFDQKNRQEDHRRVCYEEAIEPELVPAVPLVLSDPEEQGLILDHVDYCRLIDDSWIYRHIHACLGHFYCER